MFALAFSGSRDRRQLRLLLSKACWLSGCECAADAGGENPAKNWSSCELMLPGGGRVADASCKAEGLLELVMGFR